MSRFVDVVRKSKGEIQHEFASLLQDADSAPLKSVEDNSSAASVERAGEDIEEASEFREIPVEEVRVEPESRILFHTNPRSPGADRFRLLRMRLRRLWEAGKLRTLLVTSPLPQDGKSTVALNLATALAENGQRSTLLIEADLHHPTITRRLGLRPWAGLAEYLESGLNPFSAVRRLEPLGWYLLPAGQPRNNPTELLQGDALSGLIRENSRHFDWIIIDSPPLTPLTDAVSLARHADASLLVVWAGRTPCEAVEESIALLGAEHVLGIILNGVEGLNRLYSNYYGYYGNNCTSGSMVADKANEAPAPQPFGNHRSDIDSTR